MIIQSELDKLGYYALKSYNTTSIEIFKKGTNEKVITISGDSLIGCKTVWDKWVMIADKIKNLII